MNLKHLEPLGRRRLFANSFATLDPSGEVLSVVGTVNDDQIVIQPVGATISVTMNV
jgi:hypothetical protein